MGGGCECKEMHGEWKRGNITPTVGDSVEKRSDTQKLIDWYKTWKTGTILAWGRVDVAQRDRMVYQG